MKIATFLKEIFLFWMPYFMIFLVNSIFNKYFKIIFISFEIILIGLFYFFSNENTFNKYPIYIATFFLGVGANIYCFRALKFKSILTNMFRMNGYLIVFMANYIFYVFIYDPLKNFLGNYAFNLFYSGYVAVYYFLIDKSLIVLGLFIFEENFILTWREIFFFFLFKNFFFIFDWKP